MPAPDAAAVASSVVLGAAGGTRTFVPSSALIVAGRGPKGLQRYALAAMALVELAGDKVPGAPDRIEPPGLIPRMVVSGFAGHALAGRRGAGAAATAAAVGTLGTWRARSAIVEATGISDPAYAVAEDVLALTVAGLAVRSAPSAGEADGQAGEADEPADTGLAATLKDIGRGVAAAAVGTAAMTGAQLLYYRLSGDKQSQAPANVVRKALDRYGITVPRKQRQRLNWASHVGYGLSWGIPLGVAARRKPNPLKTGLGFGAAVWGASLVELPALDQSPPLWNMELYHVLLDGGFHLVYGLASGAALAALSD